MSKYICRGAQRLTWFVACAGSLVSAPTNGQQLPPVRLLSGPLYTSSEVFGAVSELRLLPDGRALLNDIIGRRLVILDSTLSQVTVVADSNTGGVSQYPRLATALIPFRGDSTLFVDPTSLSIAVLDAAGHFTRVMGWPRPKEMSLLLRSNGIAGIDQSGRFVYRGRPSFTSMKAALQSDSVRRLAARELDSVPLLRLDIPSRLVDTAAFLRFYKDDPAVNDVGDGRTLTASASDPLPVIDDWAMLPDGILAIVRAQDYHIDWVPADTSRSTAKIAHNWQFLSDSAKAAIIDSARSTALRLAGIASRLGVAPPASDSPSGSSGSTLIVVRGRASSDASIRPNVPLSDSAKRVRYLNFISPSRLPDYAPPFLKGGILPGGDGNLWIRSTTSAVTGPVYDVVSPSGHLLRRVGVPIGRVVSAVSSDGRVYTSFRASDGVHLELRRLVP